MSNLLRKILLVEDDEDQAVLIKRVFETRDKTIEMINVDSLANAKGFLSTNFADLVLTDMFLPDGTGIELLQTTNQPVIMMSCSDDNRVRENALRAGAIGYIGKASVNAFDIPELVNRSFVDWKLKQPLYQPTV
ncbi:MAG TPA: response regulator [Bacteroidales bacterium]|nr:response regulator [Bacteroidales bacterium]